MGIGAYLANAVYGASQVGLAKVRGVVSKATTAAAKAADLAGRAAMATADLAQMPARKMAAAALLTGEVAVVGAVVAVAKSTAPMRSLAGGAFQKARQTFDKLREQFLDYQPVANPCLPCLGSDSAEARAARINKRNGLIAGCEHSNDPAARVAARQLREDMKAVEMARLSENTYAQFDPAASESQRKPPEPWEVMSAEEIADANVDPGLLEDSKAVIYKVPDNFPFTPKTIVAFRGTTGEAEDILTDHDQALGMKTRQYDAAVELGKQLRQAMPIAEVTGHSLGGGKAQAAGIAGGLKGQMFNAAGLHPKSVGLPVESLGSFSSHFTQYRAEGGVMQGGGDPLTGVQNSPAAQKAAFRTAQGLQGWGQANRWALRELGIKDPLAALPDSVQELARGVANRILNVTPQEAARNLEYSAGKWYIPPAIGEVRGLTSKNADGTNTAIAAQHSVTNLVYGLESRKADNIRTLLDRTGTQEPPDHYIGKMKTGLQ